MLGGLKKGIEHMSKKKNSIGPIRITVMLIGSICAISGLEHGFFECLQGNTEPQIHMVSGKPMIYAIGDSIRFWKYGFEYAYTVIPNFFITGMTTMTISLAALIVALKFIGTRFGWAAFIMLSILQYLTGGGAAQVSLAVIVGLLGALDGRRLAFVKKLLPRKAITILAKIWPVVLTVFCAIFIHSFITAIFGFLYWVSDDNVKLSVQFGMLYAMMVILPFLLVSVLTREYLSNEITI